ncbi:hypothetical protein PAMP_005467 [Pampus punctatissimus]
MRVGEWGSGQRERTLPGGSFFLSAIINGILPLTHSSLRQTKDPAFQCSLTGQPASGSTSLPTGPKSHHGLAWQEELEVEVEEDEEEEEEEEEETLSHCMSV